MFDETEGYPQSHHNCPFHRTPSTDPLLSPGESRALYSAGPVADAGAEAFFGGGLGASFETGALMESRWMIVHGQLSANYTNIMKGKYHGIATTTIEI